jgi:pimeloyl-ACP methyl ester carboxylesterase
MRPLIMQAFNRFKVVLKSRKRADVSTKARLLQKIKDGRVIHRHAYDLFLPPIEDTLAKLDNPITSLLLLPGFGVHHSAYAEVASQISEYGIPVAVVSLQPLRLAHAKLGGSMKDVRRVIKSAGNDVTKYCKRDKSVENIVVEWDIAGHSMGGYNALQLAEEILKDGSPSITLKDGSISKVGSQIVVWAAGNLIDSVPNLQKKDTKLRILILLGSNDNIAKFASHQHKRQLLTKLPRGSRLITIKGANHSGFASYDEASRSSSTFEINGHRDMTLQDQQEEVSRRTAKWLLNDK